MELVIGIASAGVAVLTGVIVALELILDRDTYNDK